MIEYITLSDLVKKVSQDAVEKGKEIFNTSSRKSFGSGQTSPGCEGLQIYTDCIRNSCT